MMKHFNIHWRGCPHHLPQIRVASTPRASVHSPSTAQIAAEDAFRYSLSPTLVQVRRKQRYRLRRRRGRSSRGCSTVIREANARRIKHDMQTFGWDAQLEPITPIGHIGRVDLKSSPRRGSASSTPLSAFHDTNVQTMTQSTDHIAVSALKKIQPDLPDNRYSLMQVAEVPIYWTANKSVNPKQSGLGNSQADTGSSCLVGAEYSHVGRLSTVSRKSTCNLPRRLGRSRTYDPSVSHRTSSRRTKSSRPQYRNSVRSQGANTASHRSKKQVRADPNPGASQAKESASKTPSIISIVQSIISIAPSRTPSQRKALRRFTRELELYLQATRSLPKQSLIPSPSSTTVFSTRTIEELRPYHAEFQAAGLAVTSADQLKRTPLKSDIMKESSTPPPTPPKDEKWIKIRSSKERSKTYVDVDKKQNQLRKGPYKLTTTTSNSPDTTFNQCRIMDDKKSRQAKSISPTPRTTPRRTLPWLRKREEPPKVSPSTKRETDVFIGEKTTPSRQQDSCSCSIVIDFTTAPEKAVDEGFQELEGIVDGDADSGRQTRNYFRKNTAKTDLEVSCPDGKGSHETVESTITGCTDRWTTKHDSVDLNASSNRVNKNNVVMFCGPRKTLPDYSTNSSGVSGQGGPEAATVASRLPRALQGELDQEMQTYASDGSGLQGREEHRSLLSEKSTPSLGAKAGRLSSPVFSIPGSGSRLTKSPQASPSIQSPQNYLNGDKVCRETTKPSSSAVNTSRDGNFIHPPSRRPPSPPRCTQCDNEAKPKLNLKVDQERAIVWDSSHARIERSSLQCEQCPPSKLSIPVPPEKSPSSTSHSQYSPRRSNGHGLSEDSVISAHNQETPSFSEQTPNDIQGGSHYPEEIAVQADVAAESPTRVSKESPVPDPMKRPSTSEQIRTRRRAPGDYFSPLHTLDMSTPSRWSLPTPQSPGAVKSSTMPHCLAGTLPPASLEVSQRDNDKISEKDIFKGLRVATTAAYDEDVNKWIEEIAGYRVRRFLTDLSAFDGLGINTLAGVAKRVAKQRLREVQAWEKLKGSKLEEMSRQGYGM